MFRCRTSLYSTLQNNALFKFGVPPWSAVTLRCQRAPPPSDILWENLHVRWVRITIISWVFRLLLLGFALCLVAPASLSTSLIRVINDAEHTHELPPELYSTLKQLAGFVPSYALLFINTVVFPFLIAYLSSLTNCHL